jgi:hypothetical protein
MRLSASRIRSLSFRHLQAEEAAFPGIRLRHAGFPYNQKIAQEIRREIERRILPA